jgi:hypothetical protein
VERQEDDPSWGGARGPGLGGPAYQRIPSQEFCPIPAFYGFYKRIGQHISSGDVRSDIWEKQNPTEHPADCEASSVRRLTSPKRQKGIRGVKRGFFETDGKKIRWHFSRIFSVKLAFFSVNKVPVIFAILGLR